MSFSISLFIVTIWTCSLLKGSRVPLIIDTDIGTDFDDAMAVTYSLAHQDIFDIQLILMSSFNTTNRARLAAKMLQYMNNSHIDIGIGIPTPCAAAFWNCTWINSLGGVGPQFPWAADYSFSSYGPGTIYSNGVERATQILTSASPSNPVYILGISPFSNLGQIFLINPALKANTRLFTTSTLEGPGHNCNINISATQIVFNYTDKDHVPYNNDICAATGETTHWFQIYGENYQNLLNSTNHSILAKIIIENYQVWYDNGGNTFGAKKPFSPTTATSTMYDVETLYMLESMAINSNGEWCRNMEWINMEKYKIAYNDSGYMNVLPENSPLQNVWEAMAWIGGDENGTYPLGQHVVEWISKY